MELDEILKVTSAISQCYAWPAWHSTVKGRIAIPYTDMPFEIGAVEDAALITTMVSLRKLDDFLLGCRGHKDDLICEDFNIPNGEILNKEFRIEINKHVAHITTLPIQGHDLWPIFEIAHPKIIGLLDEIYASYNCNNQCQLEISLTKTFIKKQFAAMESMLKSVEA